MGSEEGHMVVAAGDGHDGFRVRGTGTDGDLSIVVVLPSRFCPEKGFVTDFIDHLNINYNP
jgi:hypothetical protein